MRYLSFGLVGVLLLAGGVTAQVADGDIVIGQFRDSTVANSYGPGSLFSVNPSTGKVFVIAPKFTTVGTILMGPNWVEMASDNTGFMVGCLPAGTSPTAVGNGLWLFSVSAAGAIQKTLIQDTTTGIGYINGFDLDFDGTWIIGAGTRLHAFDENTMTHTTLFNKTSPAGTINGLTLDPDLPKGSINILQFATNASTTANLIEADRAGVISTIATGAPFYGSTVEVDYMTGDYVCTGFGISGYNAAGGEYTRVTKAGVVTTLNYPTNAVRMFRANGLYVDKQHTSWILAYDLTGVTVPVPTTIQPTLVCALLKMAPDNTITSTYRFNTSWTRSLLAPSGITEYGSRHIVCNGTGAPGTAVKIKMSSRKASDAGNAYQCAVSLGYKNGIKFANGEYLDLTFDSWFALSISGYLPTVFQNFTGLLDASGNNKLPIVVNIPAGLPKNLGLTFYVSGVVLDNKAPGGVSTVANTHWFTIN